MKYILFLFCISILFSQDTFAEWASNKTCAPKMQTCMSTYHKKYGSRYNTPEAKAVIAQCNANYEECAMKNGVIKQDSGSYAQMYHPANPDYIACSKTISDANSDAFRKCMRDRTRPQPKREITYDGGRLAEVQVTAPRRDCSKRYPAQCRNEADCTRNNGQWDGSKCVPAQCPEGTTTDPQAPEMCKCNGEANGIVIESGSGQKCPSMCKASEHQVYDPLARSCACTEGFHDPSGIGVCFPKAASSTAVPQVDECLREFQEKVNSCNTSASTAVQKCDPNREAGSGDDSIAALQRLLGGVNGAVQAKNAGSGAVDNCVNAAIASSSGYYALEELRGKCDGEIESCKSSCADATSYIAANKEKAYEKCRKKVWDDVSCMAPWTTPYDTLSETNFNSQWDAVNRAPFERKIQELQAHVSENNAKCENGTAVANREKMTGFMDEMNNSVKSANQCQCQLSSSSAGQDCSKQAGPAECAINPTLPGCAQAAVNCLNPNETSPKCICFRNPNSNECKTSQLVGAKVNSTETSGFAGPGGVSPSTNGFGETNSGKTSAGGDVVGDISGLGDGETLNGGASDTATADAGSPFGTAGAGSAGGGTPSGGASGDAANAAASESGEDDGTGKKLGGLFNVAKSALGNLFKNGTGNKNSFNEVNKNGPNSSDANGLDSKKWRPRGMVRGLAGDTELAGKFDDIWKVMNKQYKIQDQKDSFIFGGEKN